MVETSLYIHIPFCRRRCGYCDFNTFEGMNSYLPDYVKALGKEIDFVLGQAPESLSIATIYFGGGTPSLLKKDHFEQIFWHIRQHVLISSNAEISLEANPETVTPQSILDLRNVGFNRISFGMQSAASQDLRILDRQHSNLSVENAVYWSQQAGFDQINLDLIFGIPGQTPKSWETTLKFALGLGVSHFSLYSLILEEGTRLKQWVDHGTVVQPDDDLAGEMYETAITMMEEAGFVQYEISNWAKSPEHQCRHNLQYWHYLPYLGFGAGAVSFWKNIRAENIHLIPDYIASMNQMDSQSVFPISAANLHFISMVEWELIQEHLMVSLRLTSEGVLLNEFEKRHGIKVEEIFDKQIQKLKRQGLIEIDPQERRMKLTRRGRLFGNRVFSEFIGNPPPKNLQNLTT